MSQPPSQRRRGAQPGNVNRLKHGLYSKRLPQHPEAPSSPRTTADPEFEIALARVRLLQLLERQESASPDDWLSYERAVLHYLGMITSLIQANVRRKRRWPGLETLLQSLGRHPTESQFDAILDSNLIRTSEAPREDSRDLPEEAPLEPFFSIFKHQWS